MHVKLEYFLPDGRYHSTAELNAMDENDDLEIMMIVRILRGLGRLPEAYDLGKAVHVLVHLNKPTLLLIGQ